MKELPNILCHNTLKKEMVDRFMIQAELTLKRFYDTSTAQIVDSHNLIVRDEPQENLNLRRNSNLPNRGNIDSGGARNLRLGMPNSWLCHWLLLCYKRGAARPVGRCGGAGCTWPQAAGGWLLRAGSRKGQRRW